ncbi:MULTISPECIES: HIT domain-containing protein [unclassified Thioalkalivibrio]|uniref:HIT domain-containing protein n=1 Tax=unclassified Thioalkalivibrio TaxID=2621013 RepID=UPI000362C474|nr:MULTISPECIES: HIT family protein [unclassified Thioalkalivibrio]
MTTEFRLDPRLVADTWAVAEWPLSSVRLIDHWDYPWFILVPRRPDLRELHALAVEDATQLARESRALARAMDQAFVPRALNVAKLGNIVEQLHLHHVARFEGDPAWPGPVWGAPKSRGLETQEAEDRIARVLGLVEDVGG